MLIKMFQHDSLNISDVTLNQFPWSSDHGRIHLLSPMLFLSTFDVFTMSYYSINLTYSIV